MRDQLYEGGRHLRSEQLDQQISEALRSMGLEDRSERIRRIVRDRLAAAWARAPRRQDTGLTVGGAVLSGFAPHVAIGSVLHNSDAETLRRIQRLEREQQEDDQAFQAGRMYPRRYRMRRNSRSRDLTRLQERMQRRWDRREARAR